MRYLGVSDSQKKVPPLPPSVASRSDSGSGRAFNNGATFLTFNPTDFDGKLPIIDYIITAVPESGDSITATVLTLDPFVIQGLRSGIKYRYKIKARNSVSESNDSSEVGPDTATTVPGAPTSLTAINLGNGGGITLNWVAPANGGKAITSYTITPTVGSPIVTNSTATTYAFTGTVGTTYNFTVKATNENGTGNDSTASGTVVPTAPAPVTTTTTSAPTGGGGATIGINSLSLSGISTTSQCGFNASWSTFGNPQSWRLSSGGVSSGVVNSTATSVALYGLPCNQQVGVTLEVWSGQNATGTTASRNATGTTPNLQGTGGGTTTSAPATTSAPSSPTCSGTTLLNGSGFVSYSGYDNTRCVGTTLYETPNLVYYNASTGQFITCTGSELGPYFNAPECGGGTTTSAPGTTTAAPGTTTSAPTTSAPTTTCSPLAADECFCAGCCGGSGYLSRRTCSGSCPCYPCSPCVTTAPTTSAPTTSAPTSAPTTTRSSCACRDFRGRCVPLSFCIA